MRSGVALILGDQSPRKRGTFGRGGRQALTRLSGDTESDWGVASAGQDDLGPLLAGREMWNTVFLAPSQGVWSCRHLDFKLLASSAARQ